MNELELTITGDPERAFFECGIEVRDLFDVLKAAAIETDCSVSAVFRNAKGDQFTISYQRSEGGAA